VSSAAGQSRGRLAAVLLLSVSILAVEVVGGLLANSLALLADAGHLLTDVAGIGLALLAIWFAGRLPTRDRTFGYLRLKILVAVANAVHLPARNDRSTPARRTDPRLTGPTPASASSTRAVA
jgi:cobalt-zinc-cadmium efflux system protein